MSERKVFKTLFGHVAVGKGVALDGTRVLLAVPSHEAAGQEYVRLFAPEVARELGQALIDLAEEIENPPAEVFKPGDRLRRKVDASWDIPYELTLGDGGYLQHYQDGSVTWHSGGHHIFTSESFEKVALG